MCGHPQLHAASCWDILKSPLKSPLLVKDARSAAPYWTQGIESLPPNHPGKRFASTEAKVKSLLCVVSLLIVISAVGQQTNQPAPSVTVIRAGTLIDGKAATPRHDQVIVIRGNRIESVSDAAAAKIPAGATTVD